MLRGTDPRQRPSDSTRVVIIAAWVTEGPHHTVLLQHNSRFCCMYINYLLQTILQESWKQLSVSSAVYNSLFSGTEIWTEQALTQLFSSYFLGNLFTPVFKLQSQQGWLPSPFRYGDTLIQLRMMSLLWGYAWLWQEHMVDIKSRVLPSSWSFDKKESVLDHKLSKVRTFPNVLSWLKKEKCWATLQKK